MSDQAIHYERAINLQSGACCDATGPYDLTEEVHECTCAKCLVRAMEDANGIVNECKAQLSERGLQHLIDDVLRSDENGHVDQRRRTQDRPVKEMDHAVDADRYTRLFDAILAQRRPMLYDPFDIRRVKLSGSRKHGGHVLGQTSQYKRDVWICLREATPEDWDTLTTKPSPIEMARRPEGAIDPSRVKGFALP